jgi:hypothetical protein
VGEAGLSATEVGKEISEHRERTPSGELTGHDRRVTILEAVLLAVVALLAGWSGYASAKWGTEAQLKLARASTTRTQANRANLDAMELRNFDSSTFEAWFTAYAAGNRSAMAIAERRFRPAFRTAFDAWQRTNPATNPHAASGPTFMPEYQQPELVRSKKLDAKADVLYREGAKAASTADEYVRTTVLLATVLFLVGISGHFRVRAARYGLVGVGAAIMLVAFTIIVLSPRPPA